MVKLEALKAAVDAVLDLHSKDGYGECTECVRTIEENIYGDGQYDTVHWPCPTVQAITNSLEGKS